MGDQLQQITARVSANLVVVDAPTTNDHGSLLGRWCDTHDQPYPYTQHDAARPWLTYDPDHTAHVRETRSPAPWVCAGACVVAWLRAHVRSVLLVGRDVQERRGER